MKQYHHLTKVPIEEKLKLENIKNSDIKNIAGAMYNQNMASKLRLATEFCQSALLGLGTARHLKYMEPIDELQVLIFSSFVILKIEKSEPKMSFITSSLIVYLMY